LGQDNYGRTAFRKDWIGKLGWDSQDRTMEEGQPGQDRDSWDRMTQDKPQTWQDSLMGQPVQDI
jgi:hypothetical protein